GEYRPGSGSPGDGDCPARVKRAGQSARRGQERSGYRRVLSARVGSWESIRAVRREGGTGSRGFPPRSRPRGASVIGWRDQRRPGESGFSRPEGRLGRVDEVEERDGQPPDGANQSRILQVVEILVHPV